MKSAFFCFFVLLVNFIPRAQAALDWAALESEFLKFTPERGSNVGFWRGLMSNPGWWGVDHGLKSQSIVDSQCDPRVNGTALRQLQIESGIESLWKKCEGAWSLSGDDVPTSALALFRSNFMINLDAREHPYLQRVKFLLPNGFVQTGLVGLKDSVNARPVILFRSGVFGNSVDLVGERFLLMQLFEESNFNFILLDSLASSEVLAANLPKTEGGSTSPFESPQFRYASMGMDEGLINYQVAERLQNSAEKISRLISGVHFVALSMGGHGLFQTLLLNQLNPAVISSAMAVCPLVEYKKTIEQHRRSDFLYQNINFWTAFRLSDLFWGMKSLSFRDLSWELHEWQAKNYKGPLTTESRIKMPAWQNLQSFEAGNDLAQYVDSGRAALTIFATKKDSLVPFDLNFSFLKKLQSERKANSQNWHLIEATEGDHCSFPSVYNWDAMGSMMRAQLDLQSGQLIKKVFREFPVELQSMPRDWQVVGQVGDQRLKAQFATGESLDIPLSALDWAVSESIRNPSELRALIRWLRQNSEIEKRGTSYLFRVRQY